MMKKILKESEHLLRLAGVFALGVVAFLIIRTVLVPPQFGLYGHYRPQALNEIRELPIRFAGDQACALCHDDVVKLKSEGKHANVACEACHGPLYQHADAPADFKPTLPKVATLCVRCHEADAAKPKWFPQVVSKEHSGGAACDTCHQPHKPNS
jgi:Cytochrome c554 and c-prime